MSSRPREYKSKWRYILILIQSYTLRKKALADKKFQLEQAMMDMDTIDAIEGAQTHIKDQQKYSEKLEDLILDGQEAKMQQQQINDKLKDLVDHQSQDEEIDVSFSCNVEYVK